MSGWRPTREPTDADAVASVVSPRLSTDSGLEWSVSCSWVSTSLRRQGVRCSPRQLELPRTEDAPPKRYIIAVPDELASGPPEAHQTAPVRAKSLAGNRDHSSRSFPLMGAVRLHAMVRYAVRNKLVEP